MLDDLYLLKEYFEEPFAAIYEEDLIRKYGQDHVSKAIDQGLLEHRYIPCAQGKRRCVCWLSKHGDKVARQLFAQVHQTGHA